MCKTAWMTICWIGKKEMKPGLEQIVDKNAVDAVKVIYGERK